MMQHVGRLTQRLSNQSSVVTIVSTLIFTSLTYYVCNILAHALLRTVCCLEFALDTKFMYELGCGHTMCARHSFQK